MFQAIIFRLSLRGMVVVCTWRWFAWETSQKNTFDSLQRLVFGETLPRLLLRPQTAQLHHKHPIAFMSIVLTRHFLNMFYPPKTLT